MQELLKKATSKKVKLELKNNMVVSGILVSVDRFLNIKIKNAQLETPIEQLDGLMMCSIRGSAIQTIDFDKNVDENLMLANTLLKFSLDK